MPANVSQLAFQKEVLFAVLANFHSANIPTVADLTPPTNQNAEFGRNTYNRSLHKLTPLSSHSSPGNAFSPFRSQLKHLFIRGAALILRWGRVLLFLPPYCVSLLQTHLVLCNHAFMIINYLYHTHEIVSARRTETLSGLFSIYPQHLSQYVVRKRGSINTCWINQANKQLKMDRWVDG